MIRKSVVAKLWVAIVILMIIILTLLSMGLFQLVENFYYSQIAKNLINQGQQIAELYKNAPHSLEVSAQIEMISRIINAHILIVDKEGQIQACNIMMQLPPGSVFQDRELAEVFNGQIAIKRGFHHHFDTQMLSVALPITVENEIKKAILMYTPVAPITATLESLRRLIYFGLLGSIVLASILAFFLSKTLSRPLIKMNQAAMEMAKGNFNHRIPVSSSDEIGVLSATFNFLSTQLKQNISALSYEKEKLENVLTSMTDGVITLDSAGRIILYNPQAKKFLNDCGDIKEAALLTDCVHLGEVTVLFNEVIKEKTIKKAEITLSEKTLSVRLSPLFQPENEQLLGVVIVLQDVTKERKLEQMRKEFVANVSHELRTPISLIQGYAEAIMDGLADNLEQRRSFLKIIHDEANRLKRLVDDLLELSRLQTGAIELNKEWVNVEQLCLQLRDKFKSALDQEGLVFQWEICDDAAYIWADRFRLEQIFINLMSNAIRYVQKGFIKIEAGKIEQDFLIKVSDTGVGIPAKDLPYVFERFYRADKSRNRESGGTGLGLSIVKNIVDAHGGKITVESREGKGTTFTILLPGKVYAK